MLRTAAFIVGWCIASAAFAQPAQVDSFGGYFLGMTRAEAEAANPGRWGEIVARPLNAPESEGTPIGETAAPNIAFGGRIFSTRLVFRDDQLRVMRFEHPRRVRQGQCPGIFRDVLHKLEEELGPLAGSAPSWEMGGEAGREQRTNAGSRYRVYQQLAGRAWSARANGGENYRIRMNSVHIPPGSFGVCITTIEIRDDYGVGPVFTPEEPPSLEALAAAPLSERTESVTLPGFENIQSLMPRFAFDNSIFGGARMECLVRDDRSYWCRVMEETPPGLGFGQSALASIQFVRAAPEAEGGAPTGSRVVRRLTFRDPLAGE